ncbi:MAG: DUF805 domain-containing protein [Bacteroides sp.]|nr:DUF805 domain-containing protein [Bacteroides sp.]
MYELSKSGKLTPLLRKRIEEQLSESLAEEQIEENDLTETDTNHVKTAELVDSTQTIERLSTPEEAEIVEGSEHSQLYESSESIKAFDIPTVQKVPTFPKEFNQENIVGREQEVSPSPVICLSEEANKGFIYKLFSFNGRMRRSHYLLSIIGFYVLLLIGVFFLTELSKNSIFWGFMGAVIMFFSVWFIIAARVKRCHDRGNSGWWQLYTCIPYVGAVFSLILLFGSGDEDENEYGLNPRN